LTREGLDAFLRVLIKKTWTKNPLDPRTVGALNNTTRLLLESRGWIQKTPLQIIQTQALVKQEVDWRKIFEGMTEEDRAAVIRFIQRLETSESQPSPS